MVQRLANDFGKAGGRERLLQECRAGHDESALQDLVARVAGHVEDAEPRPVLREALPIPTIPAVTSGQRREVRSASDVSAMRVSRNRKGSAQRGRSSISLA